MTGGDSNSSHGERADARSSRQHPLAALSGAACGWQARRLQGEPLQCPEGRW